jgi:hypothetical protein
MPNPIKYNVSAETLALKKGNFYIGTGDVGKGPTSSTGFYNGITPPSGGFTIYLNKASDGPAIYTVSTESQLIGLTNQIAGSNYTTSGQCLNYFATQTDKIILNRNYEPIITNGLILNVDAGFSPSYPTIGTSWYDLSTNSFTAFVVNGCGYSSDGGGSITYDGTDDWVYIPSQSVFNTLTNNFTVMGWIKPSSAAFGFNGQRLFGLGYVAQWQLELRGDNGRALCINYSQNGLNYFNANGPSIVQDSWNQVGFVINNSVVRFIFNGITYDGFTISGNFVPSGQVFSVGNYNGGGDGAYTGSIASCQLYNRVLSSSEILQNYLSFMNPKLIFGSNLKIWYDMSAPIATSNVDNQNTIDDTNNLITMSRVFDLSGNGTHLTQTTKINQPNYIPNSQNSKPANYNTGGSVYDVDATSMRASYNALTSGARSFFIVLKGAANSAFSWDRDTSNRGSLQLGYSSINGWNDLQQDASVNIGGGNGTTTYVMSYLFDTTQTLLYRNGNLNRSQSNNTYTISTGGSSPFGCWTTAPSSGNQEGYWYEMIYLNKIPTIAEYNAVVSYLGNKWGVSCGNLSNYN